MIYSENEIELPCVIEPGTVYDEKQIGQQCNKLIGLVYVETETELLRPILLGMVCDENKIGQRRDQSYKYGLCQKQN